MGCSVWVWVRSLAKLWFRHLCNTCCRFGASSIYTRGRRGHLPKSLSPLDYKLTAWVKLLMSWINLKQL